MWAVKDNSLVDEEMHSIEALVFENAFEVP